MAAPPGTRPGIKHAAWGALSLAQPQQSYRLSIDSVLLADFASPLCGPVADLGAGCEIMVTLLSRRGFKVPFLAVEIDPLASKCCRQNFAAALKMASQVLMHDLAPAAYFAEARH